MSFRLTAGNKKMRLRGGKFALIGAFTGVAATSVSVVEYLSEQIFQRTTATNNKVMTVRIGYTGNPTSLQARVVDFYTGAVVVDWTTVSISPSASPAVGSLTVPTAAKNTWYRLQVRCGVNNAINAAATYMFTVGAVVMDFGQSNMYNLANSNGAYPLATLRGARRWISSLFKHVGNYDATGTYPENTLPATYGATRTDETVRGDGGVYFANYLSAAMNMNICFIDCAQTGSNIASWQPSGGGNWSAMIGLLNAIGGDAEFWNFYQGEDNANLGTSASSYQASMQNILAGVRTQTGRTGTDLAFGVVTLGTTATYGPEESFGRIRGTQIAFIAANPVETYLLGVAADQPLGDASVHLSFAGQGVMGKRYAKAAAANRSGTNKPGPSITSAVYSGPVVTFTISGGTGTLKDGAGGTGTSLMGHRVFGNGTLATINSTVISGNTVVVTLSATPASPVTSDYGMLNAPYTLTPAAASVLYDSDTVPGHTLGLPLAPRALFTVPGG